VSFPPNSPLLSATRSKRILYLTADGILEPLGASQVSAYVVGLSELGFAYEIVSLEKEHDLADRSAVSSLQRLLREQGVRWTALPYRRGSLLRLAGTYTRMFRLARSRVGSDGVALIHARSFLMGLVAWLLCKLNGVPYIYDARGYWVDERAESGRRFRARWLYRMAKWLEERISRGAAAIVTLTDLHRKDLQADPPFTNVVTITTCVDFDRFRPDAKPDTIPADILTRLSGKLVFGLIGSVNTSYRVRESIRLFAYVKELRPDAHLLCLTQQLEDLRQLLQEQNLAEASYTIATASFSEMPQWLPFITWGLLLLQSSFAKRASMPTKLGEMFASGVRPVQYGCNEEVSALVREAGSGFVLDGIGDDHLRAAAKQIAASEISQACVLRARERMRAHFSLRFGTDQYAKLLQPLIGVDPKFAMPRTIEIS
jgi:glycosyltransferase involved in cell wall biosynthesis